MDIIDKLKKGKKGESVFESLIKKKEPQEEKKKEIENKSSDIEFTQITSDKPPLTPGSAPPTEKKPSSVEFRTEGMHEFDIESLGEAGDANIKVEYKSKVNELIDKSEIDAAINLLLELKQKLANTKKSE